MSGDFFDHIRLKKSFVDLFISNVESWNQLFYLIGELRVEGVVRECLIVVVSDNKAKINEVRLFINTYNFGILRKVLNVNISFNNLINPSSICFIVPYTKCSPTKQVTTQFTGVK